jgi:ribosomal protein S24E
MDSNKTHSTEQPLLKRTVNTYRIAYEGATPARTAIVQHLASKEKGTVVVKTIYVQTGEQVAIVTACIYKDEKVANAVERANLLAKQQPKTPAAESA